MQDPFRRPALGSAVYYKDPVAALDWLERAFGFERTMVITDRDGNLVHSEMRFGSGYIMVGGEFAEGAASPASTGGKTTQAVHAHLETGLDALYGRAKAAGAVILREPEDEFYGDRTFRAQDPEGHVWAFSETVRLVGQAEAEAASGLKIDGWPAP